MAPDQDQSLENVKIGSAVVMAPEPSVERGYLLSRQDYFLLLEGAGTGKSLAARDVCAGVFFTALVGLVGVVATLSPDWAKDEATRWRVIFFFVVLAAVTVAALAMLIWFHRHGKDEKGRQSYTACCERIEAAFAARPLTSPAPSQPSATGATSGLTAPAPAIEFAATLVRPEPELVHLLEGDRVSHPSFGRGVIVRIEGEGASRKLVVRFDDPTVGEKKVLERFVNRVAAVPAPTRR